MKRFWSLAIVLAAAALVSGLLVGAARADGAPVQYIVKPGDSLYRIAIQHSAQPFDREWAIGYVRR